MIDLADLDTDLRSAGVTEEGDRLAFMVLAKHVNGALGAPPRPASFSSPRTGERIADARLGRIAEAGERCVADGIDVMLDGISQRGLGELARELLELRERARGGPQVDHGDDVCPRPPEPYCRAETDNLVALVRARRALWAETGYVARGPDQLVERLGVQLEAARSVIVRLLAISCMIPLVDKERAASPAVGDTVAKGEGRP